MRRLNKSLAALVLSGGLVGAGIGSSAWLRSAGAVAPPQAKVTAEQLATANDLSSAFRNVGKAIEPSVVNISVHKTVKGASASPSRNDMLRRFFKENPGFDHALPDLPGDQDGQQNDDNDGGSLDQVGTGSGVIIEVDGNTGYILTNNHVAGGASEIAITLADGRRIDNAKLVGADPKSDLAVVKITADGLIAAKWGDVSTLHQGDWVMAFGSPFGYIGSMTHGIVSAMDRSNVGILGAGGYEDFIQVDAPINPGNSGGPLVNLHGEVVGINTAIASRTGAFSGIGFAIPSNEAKTVFTSLKEHGKVVRGWLGVSIADISRDPKVAASFGYAKNKGVLVESTLPDAPANGKLQPGDIIESVNGAPVDSVLQLRNTIAGMAPDTELNLTVFRDKKDMPVTVKLGTQPQDMSIASNRHGNLRHEGMSGAMGMTLSDATDDLARQFNLGDPHQGALVTAVKHGSPADIAGIRPGDMITQVDGAAVKNASEASDLLSKRDVKKGVRLYVTGAEGPRFVVIEAK